MPLSTTLVICAQFWKCVSRSLHASRNLWNICILSLGVFLTFPSLDAQPMPSKNNLDTIQNLLIQQQYKQADVMLRAYLNQHPGSADAEYLLGYTLFREQEPKESLETYTNAAKLRKPTAENLRYVALDYVLLNDYSAADKWMTLSVSWNDRDEDDWYSLGRIKYTENKFHEAMVCFNKALLLAPRDVRAENNLGLTYEGLNETDKAIAAYRTAIEWQRNSNHPSEQPLLNLGIVLINQGHFEEALSLLTQAVTIAPKDPRIHTQLGRLYAQQAELAKAQSEFEQALTYSPNDASLHFQLGQVYRREGLIDKAKQEFTRTATLNGTHSTPDKAQSPAR